MSGKTGHFGRGEPAPSAMFMIEYEQFFSEEIISDIYLSLHRFLINTWENIPEVMDSDQLHQAKAAVNSGMSIRGASATFGIPRATLQDQMKAHNINERQLSFKVPVFNSAQEKELD